MHKISSRWQQFTNLVLRAARLPRQSRGSDSSELIRFYSLNRRWPTSPQVKIEQHNQNFKAQTRKQAFRKQNWCKPKSWKISVRFSRKRKWLFDLQAILQETHWDPGRLAHTSYRHSSHDSTKTITKLLLFLANACFSEWSRLFLWKFVRGSGGGGVNCINSLAPIFLVIASPLWWKEM